MSERLHPNPELLLFLSNLLNSFNESPLYFKFELQKLLSRVVTVLSGDLFELRPFYLWTLLVKQVALFLGFITFFTDHADFPALLVYAHRKTWVAVYAAGACGRGHCFRNLSKSLVCIF